MSKRRDRSLAFLLRESQRDKGTHRTIKLRGTRKIAAEPAADDLRRQANADARLDAKVAAKAQRENAEYDKQTGGKRTIFCSSGLPPVQSEFLMLFGKHKGKTLKQIPDDYLEWVMRLDDLPGATLAVIQLHLVRKRKAIATAASVPFETGSFRYSSGLRNSGSSATMAGQHFSRR
jgi:uncharacterized protein (DUF3820 family)